MKTENEEFVPTRISKMIESRTPFAVIQFFENLILNPEEKHKKYEIMYVEKNVIKYEKFTPEILADFAFQKDMFTLVRNNKHGKIWEYGNFKEYVK